MFRRVMQETRDIGALVAKNADIFISNRTAEARAFGRRVYSALRGDSTVMSEEQSRRLANAARTAAGSVAGLGTTLVATDVVAGPKKHKKMSKEYETRLFNLNEVKGEARDRVEDSFANLERASIRYDSLTRQRDLKNALKV